MTQYVLPVKLDKGAGDVIVLLHGLGNTHESWSFVTKHLDYSKNRVVAFDLLGFGDAPKPDVDYTPADHAMAVIATLEQLGIKRAELAGHSMGCLVAIEVAKQRPELVTRLVLLGAPIYKSLPRGDWLSRLTRSGGVYFRIFSVVKRNPEAVQAGGKIADELVPLVKGMEITEQTWSAYRKSLEHTIMQFQTFRDALELQVPTLFINGILDFFIIRRNTREIARRNKRYVRTKTMVGPHEITPRQGRRIARILQQVPAPENP